MLSMNECWPEHRITSLKAYVHARWARKCGGQHMRVHVKTVNLTAMRYHQQGVQVIKAGLGSTAASDLLVPPYTALESVGAAGRNCLSHSNL
jgi:hypothetical protein